MQLAILADDLTGATDAGGALAGAGYRPVVAFGDEPVADLDVLVRSTDSRGLDAGAAAAANRRAALSLRQLPPDQQPRWVYKKIDSALRGHPCEELVAVMDGLDEARALVAPALPAEGRTTVGAEQLIEGVPAAKTAWASSGGPGSLLERFGCNQGSDVHALGLATVRRGAGQVAQAIREIEAGIVIADAATDQDLAVIARGALDAGIRMLAGSAGLARQLAAVLPAPAVRRPPVTRRHPRTPALVVAASRHDATAVQVATLRDAGIPVVRPSQGMLDGVDTSAETVVNELAAHLAQGRSAVLTTAGCDPSRLGPAFVAEQIGQVVAQLTERQRVGGLVLTGGDVAVAVLARLEASQIILGGEVRPAIPWGVLRSRLLSDVSVVTKAGSFGEPDALLGCLAHLDG